MSSKFMWVALAAALATTVAWAGAMYEAPVSACGTINCSGMTIRGVQQTNDPFSIQVFARQGECLRLDVNTQTQDMALLWVPPSVWYSEIWDDRGAGDVRPLFVRDPVPWTGWYTIVIAYYEFSDLSGKFTLEYGRYPSGNVNCQEAVTAASSLKPAGASVSKMMFGPAAGTSGVPSSSQ
jgi:hypothetical protein